MRSCSVLAVTAGDELERASTARVLEINVMAQIPILLAAIRHGVAPRRQPLVGVGLWRGGRAG